jgi:hypothetical protein
MGAIVECGYGSGMGMDTFTLYVDTLFTFKCIGNMNENSMDYQVLECQLLTPKAPRF